MLSPSKALKLCCTGSAAIRATAGVVAALASGPGMGGGFDRPVEETVVNNYSTTPMRRAGNITAWSKEAMRHFHESADQSGAQLTDASYETTGDDRNEIDTNNADNFGLR